jgi:hypothetical protein
MALQKDEEENNNRHYTGYRTELGNAPTLQSLDGFASLKSSFTSETILEMRPRRQTKMPVPFPQNAFFLISSPS